MDKYYIMDFNIKKLINFFGGVNQLNKDLNNIGINISIDTIYKWQQRKSIPLNKIEKLVTLSRAKGLNFDLNSFIKVNNSQIDINSIKFKENFQNKKIIIFDTTLRDGEQSPGASMTKEEKIRIALQLEKLGVDVIEAGFAAASVGDFESIREISKIIKNSTICSLARACEKDIILSGKSISDAKYGRIHTFIATSDLHMKYKLKKNHKEIIKSAVSAIKLAKNFTRDIEFSAEDSSRSDINFLIEIFAKVIEAGATTINIPDTVGYAMPYEWYKRIKTIIDKVPNSNQVIWSTHCHNDLGMAVANSISALNAGVTQIECTINGIGERAGNASLEEVVMALKTRKDILNYNTNIDNTKIASISKLVSTITGYIIPPNKAIVGANAFTHESGIHQDGVLKNRETYEIMSAESIGFTTNRLTLGKLSGRNAFKNKLEQLGIFLNSEVHLNKAFTRFKELADKKREIYDEDLHALVCDELNNNNDNKFKYVSLVIKTETGEPAYSKINFCYGNEELIGESFGSGPVDAIFKSIESNLNSKSKLLLYTVNAITSGTESQAEISVKLCQNNKISIGQAADIDVLVASAKAYLSALNNLNIPYVEKNEKNSFLPYNTINS